ncbi:polysaccharide lyase 6 family protein [Akkermansiaceae bacterium]|nr:polysaccharide lyase 6 family protein [Akkermansiaceae bacterium]
MIVRILYSALIVNSLPICASEYKVNSIDQFNELSLSAGDIVTWKNGSYREEGTIKFTADGTETKPIILKAESAGGVIFTGSVTMDISGDHVNVAGFHWNGGEGHNNHIEFRSGSNYANHSTIRNCAFNNLTPSGNDKHRWIVFHGTNNTVEHCSFTNKKSPGALILVELEYNNTDPVQHHISNNYFYNFQHRDPVTTHSGDSETIRVGESSFQSKSASCLIEKNYFQACDGENEIITNKSANNTYRYNTFRNCHGSLVLRHGANAHVEGNYFLGENKEGSGGIRVSDSFHTIVNNYFQDLNNDGDKWNNAITLVGGSDKTGGSSNGYQKVDNILVAFNTIYNCDDPLYFNDRSSYDPTGTFAYNLNYSTSTKGVGGDISGTGQSIKYIGNIFGGNDIGITNEGITKADAQFLPFGEIFQPNLKGIAANAAGSDYSSIVTKDLSGRLRESNALDAGAQEVSGAKGSVINKPITNADIGITVGASFIDHEGNFLKK